ncbi:MAG: gas vesicle protein [Nanoarchaeota archaeon]|nr:gas vesicle protein [Nanoarchaeota archaeon]
MIPEKYTKVGLVDLLDRALEKGVVISADVIISLADIPLIALNLRAALASVETMLDYGLMADWDEAKKAIKEKEPEEIPIMIKQT